MLKRTGKEKLHYWVKILQSWNGRSCDLAQLTHLSEFPQEFSGKTSEQLPVARRARCRNAGAQRAREPVTKATAVNPRDDSTKLRLTGTEKGRL